MIFEIITDELKHAHKYDYILYLRLQNNIQTNNLKSRIISLPSKGSFTTAEAMKIANKLDIDFNKEKSLSFRDASGVWNTPFIIIMY